MIRRRTLLIMPPALLLGGMSQPPPPVLVLTLIGSADQNPDPSGKPAPVAVRLYYLTATAKFERADVFTLLDHEQATLGQDETGSEEFVLAPSETRTVQRELKPGVQALGVVAQFRDIDQSRWRADAGVATSGPTRLNVQIAKLAVTITRSS